MTQCDDIRAGLDDWLDDLLEDSVREAIETHLAECEDCASYFERHESLADDLLMLGRAADRIADTTTTTMTTAAVPRRFRLSPTINAAAGILLLIGAGSYVAQQWLDETQNQHVAINDPNQGEIDPITEPPGTTHTRKPLFDLTTPENRLARHVESDNPRIHIVWLYDEIRPATDTADQAIRETPI